MRPELDLRPTARESGPVPARFGPARGERGGHGTMHRFSFPLKGVDARAFTAEERTSASF